jgi:hypothetical protein
MANFCYLGNVPSSFAERCLLALNSQNQAFGCAIRRIGTRRRFGLRAVNGTSLPMRMSDLRSVIGGCSRRAVIEPNRSILTQSGHFITVARRG